MWKPAPLESKSAGFLVGLNAGTEQSLEGQKHQVFVVESSEHWRKQPPFELVDLDQIPRTSLVKGFVP